MRVNIENMCVCVSTTATYYSLYLFATVCVCVCIHLTSPIINYLKDLSSLSHNKFMHVLQWLARARFRRGCKICVSKKCGLCGRGIFYVSCVVCVSILSNQMTKFIPYHLCVCVCTRIRSKVYVNLKCISLMWSGHLISLTCNLN